MATILEAFGTSNQAITVTLASLAAAGARQSTFVDNSSNLFDDVTITLKVKTNASSASTGAKSVNVYLYYTADGGTTYTEGASGSDGTITLTAPTNAIPLGNINAPTAATTYTGTFSIARVLGFVPQKWGIIVENQTGQSLDATAADAAFAKFYQGISYTVA